MVAFAVAALFVSGCKRGRQQVKLSKVLEQPGGIDKINREVILMFDYFATNRGKRLGELAYLGHTEETMRIPVLHSLSRGFVFLHHDSSEAPDYVRVPFGTHFDTRYYHIYHPTRTNNPAAPPSLVHVVSNIYSTKPAK